jgi:mannose-6-phosphate isomerase-like protein (cupin superfamily)
MIDVIKARAAATFENPHGVTARKLHGTEHVQVVQIELAPREGLRTHTTPVDVFFYVLEGNGVLEIGDESVRVEADDLVHSPAGIPHRLENASDVPFRFLVVKTPGAAAGGRH